MVVWGGAAEPLNDNRQRVVKDAPPCAGYIR